MRLTKAIVSTAAVTLLSGALLFSSANAAPPDQSGFSALEGVPVQALSAEEMQAISGELNAFDISAALVAAAAKLDKFPRLQAATLKLADYYLTNAGAINAAFIKLGIFTTCKTCP
jgi:hypothetical protein